MDAPSFSNLSDEQLTGEVERLTRDERLATASCVASLAEFDHRRLYLAAGFSSMFTYCTQHLHLGEGAAYRRIEASRLCRRFPMAIGLIAEGAVTLTSLAMLSRYLSEANHVDVLTRAIHKTKRDIERLAAELDPKPDVPTSIRRLPAEAATASFAAVEGAAAALPLDAGNGPLPAPGRPAAAAPASHRVVLSPLAPDRFRLQITMSREAHEILREVQSLMRHSVPSGDAAIIVERALALLREHLLRQKAGQVRRPRTSRRRRKAKSRTIPSDVRRVVWARDGARCAFVGRHGRCSERDRLEFHHVEPFAAGGASDAANIELRCRAHNAHEAEVFFGRRFERRGVDAADAGAGSHTGGDASAGLAAGVGAGAAAGASAAAGAEGRADMGAGAGLAHMGAGDEAMRAPPPDFPAASAG